MRGKKTKFTANTRFDRNFFKADGHALTDLFDSHLSWIGHGFPILKNEKLFQQNLFIFYFRNVNLES